ncbi:MAG: GntR family transcriptional regulator [Candidatus Limiplasma sp.]|nr:GntR family transcriptional regulator [Candidatus Limiplasma sp.]
MEPKYQAVADSLRHDIATGQYSDGDALLTEAELKLKFNVSRQTVRQAIALLENDGLVMRRRGSGTYVNHGARKHNGALCVGVITTYITDYIFPSIVRGVESALSAESCIMNLSATYNRTDHERLLLQRVLESPVDGLIIEGTKTALPNPNISLYEKLWERNIPFVFINGYYPQLPNAVYVVTDDVAGGRMAVTYLAERGFTRIGGIFKSDDMQGHLRYQGFSTELQERGLAVRDESVLWFSTENKRRCLRDETGLEFIRSLQSGVDAVVCYNDEIALELMDVLTGAHLSVPQDVSLVSFDNSAYAGICYPKLTSLSHPKDAFGREAAVKLMNMIAGRKETSTVMPWQWFERDSVR